jgi:phosphatidylserine decarboxylase
MGSTVILLFQRGHAHLNPQLRAGTIVKLGQSLGILQ